MTQREALRKLLETLRNGHAQNIADAKDDANAALARNDELTLEEVRLLLIKDDERAGFKQQVVIHEKGFALLKTSNGLEFFTTPVIPPHNADGSIPENGHKDIPEGQAPSMDGLRTMLDR